MTRDVFRSAMVRRTGNIGVIICSLCALLLSMTAPASAMTNAQRKAFDYGFGYVNTEESVVCGIGSGSPSLRGGTNPEQAFNYFVDKGLTPYQSAGIVGNLLQETANVNPDSDNPGQSGNTVGGGIAQWEGQRWQDLLAFAEQKGLPWNTLAVQLEFMWQELNGSQKNGLGAVKAVAASNTTVAGLRDALSSALGGLSNYQSFMLQPNQVFDRTHQSSGDIPESHEVSPARGAAVAISIAYERPSQNTNPNTGRPYAENEQRGNYAEQALQDFGGGVANAANSSDCRGGTTTCGIGPGGNYCWPIAPGTKLPSPHYSTIPCSNLTSGCHHDYPAADLYYPCQTFTPQPCSGNQGASGSPEFAITSGKAVGVQIGTYCQPGSGGCRYETPANGRYCDAMGIQTPDGDYWWYGHMKLDEGIIEGQEVVAGQRLGVSAPVEYGVFCFNSIPHLHIHLNRPGARHSIDIIEILNTMYNELPEM